MLKLKRIINYIFNIPINRITNKFLSSFYIYIFKDFVSRKIIFRLTSNTWNVVMGGGAIIV